MYKIEIEDNYMGGYDVVVSDEKNGKSFYFDAPWELCEYTMKLEMLCRDTKGLLKAFSNDFTTGMTPNDVKYVYDALELDDDEE